MKPMFFNPMFRQPQNRSRNQARRHTTRSTIFYLALLVLSLLILAGACTMHTPIVSALPLFEPDPVRQAWQKAKEIGGYDFRTDAQQINYPTVRLENAGRSPQSRHIIIDGALDLPHEQMLLRIWNQGDNSHVEMRIEAGKTYGRINSTDPWTEMAESVDLFAPGGDPLGFLVAAENIQSTTIAPADESSGIYQRTFALDPAAYARYTFDINSLKFADYMRNLMEEELRRKGELPPGLSLGTLDQYVEMTASGELWIDEQGLPARQIIHMEFPPERGAYSRLEAVISSDFSGWKPKTTVRTLDLWQHPQTFLQDLVASIGLSPADIQQLGYLLGLSLLLGATMRLVWTYRQTRQVQGALALVIITSMVVTPLLQANRIYAFGMKQAAKKAEYLAERQSQETAEALPGNNYNPKQNPLAKASESAPSIALAKSQVGLSGPSAGTSAIAAAQIICDVSIAANDCDNDGLTNGLEIYELGTDPQDQDTDSDGISDKTEVEGFSIAGSGAWYLDPLNPDSNRDGQIDSVACSNMIDIDPDGNRGPPQFTACQDTDGDTTPDAFDFDIDGDGVPNSADSSPYYRGSISTSALDAFSLSLAGYETDYPILVDIELRPTNPDDLWQTNNIYNWPANDTDGQVIRKRDNTFFDINTTDNPDPALADGDVMLTPLLELTIPDPATSTMPSAGLPILDLIDVAAYDFGANHINEWLDKEALKTYGISVRQSVETLGPIYIYIPLTVIKDLTGDMAVAWGAQMLYRPETAWAANYTHTAKLLWMVTALTDTCNEEGKPDGEAYDTWCADDVNWTTKESIIQAYYEDFTITGLTVSEERGAAAIAIAQENALDKNYADRLWHLADKLQETFIEGIQISAGNRFDVTELQNRFGSSPTYSNGASELWGISNDELASATVSAADPANTMKTLIESGIPTLLNDTYGPLQNEPVTLLFAREENRRLTGLSDAGITVSGNAALTIDFTDKRELTLTALHWGAFEYNGTKWQPKDLNDYFDALEDRWYGAGTEFTTAALKDLTNEDNEDTLEAENLTRIGAISLAKTFYLAFHRSFSNIVAVRDISTGQSNFVSSDTIIETDLALPNREVVVDIVANMLGLYSTILAAATSLPQDVVNDQGVAVAGTYLQGSFSERSSILIGMASVEAILDPNQWAVDAASVGWARFANRVFQRELPGLMVAGPKIDGVEVDAGDNAWDTATVFAMAALTVQLVGALSGWDEDKTLIAASSLNLVAAGYDLAGAVRAYKVFKLASAVEGFDLATDAAVKSLKTGSRICAVIGFVFTVSLAIGLLIYTAVSQGLQWGSLDLNALIAGTIASIIVAIIALVIVLALPLIGPIIVSVVALIDLIIAAVCWGVDKYAKRTKDTNGDGEVNDEDDVIHPDTEKWVCGGISGAVTSAIADTIYDQYVTVDFDADDRIDTALEDPAIGDTGFIVGNSIGSNVTLTNTLPLKEPERLMIRSTYIKADGTIDRDTLKRIMKRSNFVYSMQTEALEDVHSDLDLFALDAHPEDERVYPLSWNRVFDSPGVNLKVGPYLTEGYAVAVIECWGFFGAIEEVSCDEDESIKGTSNVDLRGEFTFDILPDTISGFATEFTDLDAVDRDGDGLLRSQDPNDLAADTDNDGLSDFWERNNGTNPRLSDTDSDGLLDYWEIHYGTNPREADVDGDGLTDDEEFYHPGTISPMVATDNVGWRGGWRYTYAFTDSNDPLQTQVSADPYLSDSDFDTIRDNFEFIYGYNPLVTSELNVLSLETDIQTASTVPGYATLGETIGYTATIQNELRNRVLNGLFEAEYPVDNPVDQIVYGNLYPQRSTSIDGDLTINETGTTSVTLRAGAVVNTTNVDEVFVLQFNEAPGSATFFDATFAQRDFVCAAGYPSSDCPTSNGGTATFDGTDGIKTGHDAAFDQDAFTLSMWFIPEISGSTQTLYEDLNDVLVQINASGKIEVYIDTNLKITGSQQLRVGQRYNVAITYDGATITLYVNGLSDGSSAVNAITRDAGDILIGLLAYIELDEVILYNYAFTKSQIQEVFGHLAFYWSFDDDTVTLQGLDSPYDELCASYDEVLRGKNNSKLNCSLEPYLGGTKYWGQRHAADQGISGGAIRYWEREPAGDSYSPLYMVEEPLEDFAATDGAFSVSMWVNLDKLTIAPTTNKEMGLLGLNFGDVEMWADFSGNPAYQYTPSSGDLKLELKNCTFTVSDILESGRWEHIVLTYDGIGEVNIYNEGELQRTNPGCGVMDLKTLRVIKVGTYNPAGASMSGDMDELRLYSKELTPGEVEQLYHTTGRVVDLNFDEPPGQSLFADATVYKNNGTCSGDTCPDSGLPGISNQALRFDGVDDFVTLTTLNDLGLTERSFTVMAWFKGTGTILGTQETDAQQGLWLNVNASGLPRFVIFGNDEPISETNIDTTEWRHIAFRYHYDEESGTGEQAILVDGVELVSIADQPPLAGTGIAYLGTGLGDYFSGLMDNVVIAGEALSDAQIQDAMNEAPLFSLHLDEDLNTTTFHNEGNANSNATCSGDVCPSAGAKGRMREAPVFDGNDKLTLPSLANFDEAVSVMLWVKPTKTNSDTQYLLGSSDYAVNEFKVMLEPGSTSLKLRIWQATDLGAGTICLGNDHTVSDKLPEDQWSHVAITFEPGDSSNTVIVYINGNRVSQVNYGDLCAFDLTTIGENFIGQLDEINIYNAFLSDEEIDALYDYQAAWYDTTIHHDITVDDDAPVVTVDFPTYLAEEPTLLQFSAVDMTSVVDNVEIRLTLPDDSVISGLTATSSAGTGNGAWLYNFTPTGGPGNYDITILATDAVGHQTTATDSILVDNTAPSATLDASLTAGFVIPDPSGYEHLFGTISDAGTVSSGVATDTVSVEVVDWQGALDKGYQPATSDGATWEIDYPFEARPYGRYEVKLAAEDTVGNTYAGTVGIISLDGVGPYADISVGGAVISSSRSILRGSVSEVPLPAQSNLLHLHFEETSGAASFVDSSLYQFVATCDDGAGSCPTSGSSGYYGQAVQFDGNDDLTIAAQTGLTLTKGTLMAWVQPNLSADGTLLAMANGPQTGFQWQIQGDLQALLINNGGSVGSIPVSLTNGEWTHLALTSNDDTWTAYVDGVVAGSINQAVSIPTSLPLHIGSANGSSNYFNGLLDEVVIYNNPLTADEIYDIANPLTTTVSDVEIQLRHLNGGVWPDVAADGLRLYLPLDDAAGTAEFDYNSHLDYGVTCDEVAGTCPTSGINGRYDGAVTFDGDDYITISDETNFDFQEMTVAFWMRANSASQSGEALITKGSDSWQITMSLANNLRLLTFTTPGVETDVGSTTMVGTQVLQDDVWYHVAVVYDGSTKSIYVNGNVKGTEDVTGTLTTNDTPVLLGANADLLGSGNDLRFNGSLDEVVFFDRALSQAEINALRTSAPWQDVTLDTPGNIYSTWQTPLPSDMEGIYAISLRTTDSVGNIRTIPNIWQGTIDVNPPHASFIYQPLSGNTAQVYCQAEDFSLDISRWVCPATSLTATTSDSDWLLETFPGLSITETLASTQEVVPTSGVTALTACDTSGNCTTLTQTTITELSTILTPASGTALTNYDPITISGEAFSERGILFASLYINDELVYTKIWQDDGPITSGTWSTTWTPPAGSPTFSLKAYVATDDWDSLQPFPNSDTVIESAETVLTAPPLSIEKTAAPSYMISQGDTVTYTIVVANNTAATNLTGVVITDTLPDGVSGTGLSATVDLAAGEAVTYTIPAIVTASQFEAVINTAHVAHNTTSLEDSASFFSCAETIEVQNANDFGNGSLGQAVSDICEGGTITFADDFQIQVRGAYGVEKGITIDGSGHTIELLALEELFLIRNTTSPVVLKNLQMHALFWGEAGGFLASGPDTNLALQEVIASGPMSLGGTTTILNSFINLTGNPNATQLPVLNVGGTLTIVNSTLSHAFGEPLNTYALRSTFGGQVHLIHSTIVSEGSAMLMDIPPNNADAISELTFTNSIFVDVGDPFTGNPGEGCTGTGTFIDGGHNIFGAGQGCPTDSGTSQTVDPASLFTAVLAELSDNGGNIQTYALLAGSPALDAIPSATSGCGTDYTTDQRGVTRPQFGGCDIGAYEFDGSNVAPVLAVIPAQSVVQGETLTFTATAGDANGDSLTFSLGDAPASAAIDSASGLFTWTPDTAGSYTATVIVSDGLLTDSQVVDITVTEPNVAPIAATDAYTVEVDRVLAVSAPGILANDSDANGDALSAVLVGDPASGSVMLNTDGSFAYTPTAAFIGSDSFTYQAGDGVEVSEVTTVTVAVTERMPLLYLPFNETVGATVFADASGHGNDAACDAVAGQCPTAGQSSVVGSALLFDGTDDALSVPNLLDPAQTGFTAALWFNPSIIGPEQRNMLVQQNGTGTGRVWLALNPQGRLFSNLGGVVIVSSKPAGVDQWYHAVVSYDGTTLKLYLDGQLVASNDIALETSDGDMVVSAWKNLTVFNFAGDLDEVFIYDSALPEADITELATPPVQAQADAYTADAVSVLNVAAPGVLANDVDVDGQALTATLVSTPTNGAVTLNGDGSFSYTPTPFYEGSDSFTYQASNGTDLSIVTEVVLSVTLTSQVLYLPLDEADGATNFSDLSGNGNTATCDSAAGQCPTAGKPAPFTTSVRFDEVNDYLTIPSVIDPGDDEFTVALWFRMPDFGAQNRILLSQEDGTGVGRTWLGIQPSGRFFSFLGGASTVASPTTIEPSQWYHGALTYDGATLRLYLDGVQVGQASRNVENSDGQLLFGVDKTLRRFYKGTIDEVMIFDRVVTEATIAALATFEDDDGDGIADSLELGAPNNGDGNSDGVADIDQDNVSSLPAAGDGEGDYVTLAAPADSTLTMVTVSAVPQSEDGTSPAGVEFPIGYVNFNVQNVAVGGALTVDIFPPDLSAFTTYYKYGSPAAGQPEQWYEFLYDGTTGAQFLTDRIRLHFVDGERGDADLTANGVIVDPGIPSTINVAVIRQIVNEPVTVSIPFVRFDAEVQTAMWVWGDGTTTPATFDAASGGFIDSHTYSAAGNYQAVLAVTGNENARLRFSRALDVTIYDPDAGKTAGGGKIASPAGAYKLDPSISGLVDFNLPVDYKYLFDLVELDRQYGVQLDAQQVTAELRAAFADKGYILTPDATVTVVRAGSEWEIASAGITYTIRNEVDALKVYGEQHDATQPEGNFRFNFKEADMDFVAENYGWLVVRPDGTAMARGRGTINGQMDANGKPYHFQFWATDGDPDTLRVRIWSRDNRPFVWWLETGGTVIYDNGSELPINNGNVQVIVSNSNGNGNGNSDSTAAQTDNRTAPAAPADTTDGAAVDQTLEHQLYLPFVTN